MGHPYLCTCVAGQSWITIPVRIKGVRLGTQFVERRLLEPNLVYYKLPSPT